MSAPRRSARIAAREHNRDIALRALNTLADALQETLDLLDQVYAVKDGWLTVIMNQIICEEDNIAGPITGLLTIARSSRDVLKNVRLLAEAAKRTRALTRTIRGGDHRPLDHLEEITRTMLNTVQTLLNRFA
jgi:hypothetical protein